MNVELPEHLKGVIWAYDEDARAIVCLLTGKGFSLPWLERAWNVSHERLRDGLPSARTRLEYLGPAPGSPAAGRLVSAKGEPLKLRHG